MDSELTVEQSPLRIVEKFFDSHRFPAFAISLLMSFCLALVLILFVPPSMDSLGAFAEEFKVLCFGYDPATGMMRWSAVASFFMGPALLALIVIGLWGQTLIPILRSSPRCLIVPATLGFLVVASALIILLASFEPVRTSTPEFPAERLRTHFSLPKFSLVDHKGTVVSSGEFGGKVVLMTAFFSRCGYTCPLILNELKQVNSLISDEERKKLRILAITLDPEHDTPSMLATTFKSHGLEGMPIELLSGSPQTVNETLDNLSIFRKKNEETGVIDHANIFLLVDKDGKIAYRFALGAAQREWLEKALRLLIAEADTQAH